MPRHNAICNKSGKRHTTEQCRRSHAATDDYYHYRYHCPTSTSPQCSSDTSTVQSHEPSSSRQLMRDSSAQEGKEYCMIENYSPVFSVKYHYCYNKRTCACEVSYVTRSVHSAYSHTGHDHVCLSIHCAQKTAQIVRDFLCAVNTHGWLITVQIPTKTSVKKSKTTITNVARREMATSSYERSYCHNLGRDVQQTTTKHTWCAPALKEAYLPNKKTIMCNSGWVTDDCDNTSKELLSALPHYSFMWSGRQFMIASLQASIARRERRITIIAPTLMSREGNVYGFEDIGMKGICNYFYWNPSSRYVPNFVKPRDTQFRYNSSPQNLVQRLSC